MNEILTKPIKSDEKLYTFVFNVLVAVLIWLFGVLILIPLTNLSIYWDLRLIVSFIVFFSFSLFMIRGLKYLDEMLDFVSWYINYKWSEGRELNQKHEARSKELWRKGLDVLMLVLIYLFYSPILLNLHQAVNGVALIIIVLVAFFTVLRNV